MYEYSFGPTIRRVSSRPLQLPSISSGAQAASSYFLPKGFPGSVGADYVPYSAWSAVATACGSAGGVLSTQLLLTAVGVGQTPALPLAASLSWVLKDGIGQLGAMLSAAVISDRFDADPKRWRAVAAVAEVVARSLNAITPFMPWAFLPLASSANLGYSVACLAASATKADFHRSLTRSHNLGDLTAKAGSQAIMSSLVGTAVAVGISAAAVNTHAHAFLGCLLFSASQLVAVERSMQSLALSTLTPAAGATLLRAYLRGGALPTPSQFASEGVHVMSLYSLVFGTQLTTRIGSLSTIEALPDAEALDEARSGCNGARHLLTISSSGAVRVIMHEEASGNDVLLALLHAGLVQDSYDKDPSIGDPEEVHAKLMEARKRLPSFVGEIRRCGWDMGSASKLEAIPSRLSFIGDESNMSHERDLR